MVRFPLSFLITLTLACSGAVDDSDRSATLATGSGAVAAPDEVSITYTVSGSGSPALVFIHGWMGDQTFWSAQVGAFESENTVVTIDLPGHGQSGMERDGWTLMALGADVQTVVEYLDLTEVVLIGHSMGGPVALEAARLMPERAIGVIAVDSLQDADAKYDPEQMKGRLAAFESDFVGTCEQFSTSMFLEGSDPALVERVTSDMCDGSPEIAIALLREFFGYEMGPALAAVGVPVRFLNADMWPTNIEINRTYQPNFDGLVMEGAGHFLMMEEPDSFNKLLKQIIANLDQPAL